MLLRKYCHRRSRGHTKFPASCTLSAPNPKSTLHTYYITSKQPQSYHSILDIARNQTSAHSLASQKFHRRRGQERLRLSDRASNHHLKLRHREKVLDFSDRLAAKQPVPAKAPPLASLSRLYRLANVVISHIDLPDIVSVVRLDIPVVLGKFNIRSGFKNCASFQNFILNADRHHKRRKSKRSWLRIPSGGKIAGCDQCE